MIYVKVIADSKHDRHRLTTIEYGLPTYLLAELNTHRVFSRNARSARATPPKRLLEEIYSTPAIPVWGSEQPGLRAGDCTDEQQRRATVTWLRARDCAANAAEDLLCNNIHKQCANRIIAPFTWTRGVISSTEWDNFLELRCSHTAEPNMQIFAMEVARALENSAPVERHHEEWHIPYIYGDEYDMELDVKLKISVARCARVCTGSRDGGINADIALYSKLLKDKHFSPFEHQARAPALMEKYNIARNTFNAIINGKPIITPYRNFTGWIQYRSGVEKKFG